MVDNIILEMKNIVKDFPGVRALDHVSFELKKGEVHALCGENGAGKSTLLKILTGIYQKDSGDYLYHGNQVDFQSIREAKDNGISLIPQEVELIPEMTVEENILLGRFPRRYGLVNWSQVKKEAGELMANLGQAGKVIDSKTLAKKLSMGQKQLVEIVAALINHIDILAFDEPTSSLSDEEIANLFKMIKRFKAQGISIIYVSHRLDEIFEVCDRVTVLKDGNYVDTCSILDIEKDELIEMMVGKKFLGIREKKEDKSRRLKDASPLLSVKNFSRRPLFHDINLELRSGEILGLFGMQGSGRTEFARALFGLDEKESGTVIMEGEEIEIKSSMDAVSLGFGFVTDDRHGEGLILDQSVRKNISMPILRKIASFGWVDEQREKEVVDKYVDSLSIKTPSTEIEVDSLSGGNQQKVVISKWLAIQPRILIFDEPTRGIDVGAKAEVYKLMRELAHEGKGIIMISSELPEIMGISDRILIFKDGQIANILENNEELTQQEVLNDAILINHEKGVNV